MDQKSKLWIRTILVKVRFYKDSLSNVFFYWNTPSGKNFRKIGPYLGEWKGINSPENGSSIVVDLVGKTLKIFDLTTTNVIMMKLTSGMCLHKISHLVQKCGHNSKGVRGHRQKTFYKELENQFFWLNFFTFSGEIENHHMWDALFCITSFGEVQAKKPPEAT